MRSELRNQKSEIGMWALGRLMRRGMFLLTSGFWLLNSALAAPIATDSRIKTFVFNPNEVYAVTTHYGYQSNIEFGSHETIDTVSIGDRVGWQIIPAGRRLFIRAMEENAHTNMTIVTNQRAYQFDLRSSSADAVFGSEQLTYVVRFFYPDDAASGAPMPVSFTAPAPVAAVIAPPSAPPAPPVTPISAAPVATGVIPARSATSAIANYRYTFSGPDTLAPLKIYDDGRSTYFKLPGGVAPQVAVITAAGQALAVPSRRTLDGLLAVDLIAPRFSLEQAGQQIIVYNEAQG